MSKSEINHINSWEVKLEDTTPVMQQYLKIKQENPEILLWYRLGDFYETFFEDALIMSKELELTLTGRDAGPKLGRIPLAGIPAKSADSYLEKLVQKNFKVAICKYFYTHTCKKNSSYYNYSNNKENTGGKHGLRIARN